MSEPLHTLLQQLERERDAALAALMKAETQSNRALAQQAQLRGFQDEARQRAPGRQGEAASMALLQVHQGFAERLDQALAQQQDTLARTDAELLARRQALRRAETRLAAVAKLLQRRQAEQQLQDRRREQRQSDEAAALRHRHQSPSRFGNLS